LGGDSCAHSLRASAVSRLWFYINIVVNCGIQSPRTRFAEDEETL